jgi:hypothetical protein
MNSAVQQYDLPPVKKLTAVTICPGPNIAYFSKIVSLREITDHIYGRANIISALGRPHMFIKELKLNIDYLQERIDDLKEKNDKILKEITVFAEQLLKGVAYYRKLSEQIAKTRFETFIHELDICESMIRNALTNRPEPVSH